jgi:dipeptidyl aminopeptidase/acylaminoacyl peptidase
VIRDLKSGDERWLADPVQRDDQESIAVSGVLPAMAFTPDSKHLLASFGGKINKIDISNGSYTEIAYEVDGKLELGPEVLFKYPIKDTAAALATQIRDAVPSPDGSRLAFTVLNRLYVMEYPNGTPKRLTTNDFTEAHPSWSPDGKQLIFSSWSPAGGHIHSIAADGSNLKTLTKVPGLYQSPRFTLKGDRIIYVHAPNQKFRDAFDPGYDDAEDHVRIERIASLLRSLDELPAEAKQDLFEQAQEVVEHNWNHFYGGGFERVLWIEIQEMLNGIKSNIGPDNPG